MQAQSAATTLMVSNLDRSLTYYKDVLGFTEDFRFGNYAGVKIGEVQVHLSQFGNPNSKPVGAGSMYIFCDEVDDYYREITAKGAKAQNPPKDYEYGMRDFIVEDPDGNFIGFGTPAKKDQV
jgi:catechol 2,3-dioxygenase-like lactoylglutathione lyase family enzyme